MKKYMVICRVVVAASVYWFFDLAQHLTLEGIKAAQGQLEDWRNSSPFLDYDWKLNSKN